MPLPAAAPRPGLSLPAALAATLATFLLVAAVVGSLEFGLVWGAGGLFDLPQSLVEGALVVTGVLAVLIGAKAAWRCWRAERAPEQSSTDEPLV